MQLLADASKPDPHMAFATMNCRMYEEMMTLARGTWQWALVVAVILEEQMERMCCSTGHWHSTGHWCSSSHWCSASCRRSWSLGWWEESPQAVPCCGETEVKPGSLQAHSCQGGKVDIDFLQHWRTSQVTSHWGALLKNEPSHPAPQGRYVRWPSLKGEHPCWGRAQDMGQGNAHVMLGQKWAISWTHQHGRLRQHHRRWLIGWDQEEDVDLKCPPPLEPPPTTPGWGGALPSGHQGRRWPPAPPTSTSPPPPSPCEDPEHSPLHASEWTEWHARSVQMPSWWEELTKITSHTDHKEFAWKVCTSFKVPKACNQAKKVNNYHVHLLAHPLIGKHHFLLSRDARFHAQNICLTQL